MHLIQIVLLLCSEYKIFFPSSHSHAGGWLLINFTFFYYYNGTDIYRLMRPQFLFNFKPSFQSIIYQKEDFFRQFIHFTCILSVRRFVQWFFALFFITISFAFQINIIIYFIHFNVKLQRRVEGSYYFESFHFKYLHMFHYLFF